MSQTSYSDQFSRYPKQCSACNKDIWARTTIAYTIKDKPRLAFCSQACRATMTGEEVRERPARNRAPIVSESPAHNFKPGDKVKVSGLRPAKEKTAKAPAPWANLEGKMKIVRKDQKFGGARAQVFALIKNGMKVKELYALCDKAGLDGKSNLAKIIGVYNCVEVS